MFWSLIWYSFFGWLIFFGLNLDAFRRSVIADDTKAGRPKSKLRDVYWNYVVDNWIMVTCSFIVMIAITNIINQGGLFVLLKIVQVPDAMIESLKSEKDLLVVINKMFSLIFGIGSEVALNLLRRWVKPASVTA